MITWVTYLKDPEGQRRAYYAQFVDSRTISHVLDRVVGDRLIRWRDEGFRGLGAALTQSVCDGLPLAIETSTVGDLPCNRLALEVVREAVEQWLDYRAGVENEYEEA